MDENVQLVQASSGQSDVIRVFSSASTLEKVMLLLAVGLLSLTTMAATNILLKKCLHCWLHLLTQWKSTTNIGTMESE